MAQAFRDRSGGKRAIKREKVLLPMQSAGHNVLLLAGQKEQLKAINDLVHRFQKA